MKKLILVAASVLTVSLALAKPMPPAVVERLGGFWDRPDALKGKIFIVNAQKIVAATNLTSAIEIIKSNTNVTTLEFIDGPSATPQTAADALKKLDACAAIFLVDDAQSSTTMLLAPENRWAILNVAALKADGAGQPYYDARTRKELVRTFLALTGALDSNYPNSLMTFINSPKDLDKMVNENPPMDVVGRTRSYLPKLGVESRRKATYLQACKEGWAPAPKTEAQKKIWARVHNEIEKGPANGIKITPPANTNKTNTATK